MLAYIPYMDPMGTDTLKNSMATIKFRTRLDACRCQPISTWKACLGSCNTSPIFRGLDPHGPMFFQSQALLDAIISFIISFIISLISFFSFPQLSPSFVSVSSGTTCITTGSQTVKLSIYGVDQNLVVDLDLGHWKSPAVACGPTNSYKFNGHFRNRLIGGTNPIYKASHI